MNRYDRGYQHRVARAYDMDLIDRNFAVRRRGGFGAGERGARPGPRGEQLGYDRGFSAHYGQGWGGSFQGAFRGDHAYDTPFRPRPDPYRRGPRYDRGW